VGKSSQLDILLVKLLLVLYCLLHGSNFCSHAKFVTFLWHVHCNACHCTTTCSLLLIPVYHLHISSISSWLHANLQINRLAGMAVMLHCLIPTAWVPPLSPPTASPVLGKPILTSQTASSTYSQAKYYVCLSNTGTTILELPLDELTGISTLASENLAFLCATYCSLFLL